MSKKIYKGKEILKMIADGEIYYGTKFKIEDWNEIVVYEQRNLIFREIFYTKEEGRNYGKKIFDLWNLDYILDLTFELIEDEVYIDNIEELLKIEEYEVDKTDVVLNRNKINKVIQAVKQLNKEIKSIKEK